MIKQINESPKKGIVIESLPDRFFRVEMEDKTILLAYLSGKMKINKISILLGDEVVVETTPYDKTRGRIIYRNKK